MKRSSSRYGGSNGLQLRLISLRKGGAFAFD
jgi:hypothetical protein